MDKGHADKAAEKLKVGIPSTTKKLVGATESAQSDNSDDEFLASRILFLLTYDTNLDFDPLVREKGLSDAITQVWRSLVHPCRAPLTLGHRASPGTPSGFQRMARSNLPLSWMTWRFPRL